MIEGIKMGPNIHRMLTQLRERNPGCGWLTKNEEDAVEAMIEMWFQQFAQTVKDSWDASDICDAILYDGWPSPTSDELEERLELISADDDMWQRQLEYFESGLA